jgi:hypothetical protein
MGSLNDPRCRTTIRSAFGDLKRSYKGLRTPVYRVSCVHSCLNFHLRTGDRYQIPIQRLPVKVRDITMWGSSCRVRRGSWATHMRFTGEATCAALIVE